MDPTRKCQIDVSSMSILWSLLSGLFRPSNPTNGDDRQWKSCLNPPPQQNSSVRAQFHYGRGTTVNIIDTKRKYSVTKGLGINMDLANQHKREPMAISWTGISSGSTVDAGVRFDITESSLNTYSAAPL